MIKKIFFTFSLIFIIILFLPDLLNILKEKEAISIKEVELLKNKALFENNKTAAEKLIFINMKNNNKEEAKKWVNIAYKIEINSSRN